MEMELLWSWEDGDLRGLTGGILSGFEELCLVWRKRYHARW